MSPCLVSESRAFRQSARSLQTLSLENNELTGPLPLSLARLKWLDEFSYFNSGLCVPDDGSFRAWLESLPVHRGTGVDCKSRNGHAP